MPSVIAQLSQQLFSFQREFTAPEQRRSLEATLEAVISQRMRPALAAQLGLQRAQELLEGVREDFMLHAGSIMPGEVGRFLHAAIHRRLQDELPQAELAGDTQLEQQWHSLSASVSDRLQLLVCYLDELGASRAEIRRALGCSESEVNSALQAAGVTGPAPSGAASG